jgi:hypothetical protein
MLKKKHSTGKHLPRGLEILYEDRDPEKDIGIQKIKKTSFGLEVSVI